MLPRYDLEKKLLSGELAVRELPEALERGHGAALWKVRPGVCCRGLPAGHSLGGWARSGYFPSYARRRDHGVQLSGGTLRNAAPDLEAQIARGEFAGLFGWLGENVHSMGAKVPVNELMKQATGQPLSAAALLRYLETKYLGDAP